MPELPEIRTLATGMQASLPGRRIHKLAVGQPKCLNLPEDEFEAALAGAEILGISAHGKWIQVQISTGWLLLGLGMGGEILLADWDTLPEKHQVVIGFDDGDCLAINFWWFGYVHFVRALEDHPMISRLGPDFMRLSERDFRELLGGRRGAIKTFLLDQKRLAGIGNVYVQDPLFTAGIHPLRRINTLTYDEIGKLWQALRETLQQSMDLGGSHWEQNLYGQRGRWDDSYFLVAYCEGHPCPSCGATVLKVKTGSTSSYICQQCQPEETASPASERT